MSKPIDAVLVAERLDTITADMRRLRESLGVGRQAFLGERFRIDAVERQIQVIAQAIIDVGSQIIVSKQLAMPSEYGHIAGRLVDAEVLSPELAARIRKLIGLRNLLVHGYLKIDPARLYDDAVTGLADVAGFVTAVKNYLAAPNDKE